MAQQKTCYIISPIGDPDSKERKWADFVRKNIIEPTVIECGYESPARSDDPEKELIMTDIIEQMFDSDLVVADLTFLNPNVFYELGIRHCAQKPAIHLIETGISPPFDLGSNKAISISRDFEKVVEARSEIKARIQAIEKDPEQFHSQVHLHIKLKQLKLFEKSANVIDKGFANTLSLLVRTASLHSDLLGKLFDELVTKPKQLKARYPTPTLSVFEQIAAGQFPHSYAEKFPNLSEALALGHDNKAIPPSEDKK